MKFIHTINRKCELYLSFHRGERLMACTYINSTWFRLIQFWWPEWQENEHFFLLFIVRKKWNKNFCNDLAAQKVIRHSIYHFFLGLKKNEIYDFFLSLSYIQDFFSNFYSGCCSFYSLLIWWLWNSKHDAGTIAILHKWDGTSSYGTACTLDYHFP